MKPEASLSEIQWSGELAFRYRMMREVVESVEQKGTLFMPLLNLIATFIDGLALGPKGGTKKAYLAYLRNHFPDLCSALSAEVFYNSYRNKAVHEFDLKQGYGIGRDSGMHGAYSGTQRIKETGEAITVLNIDRLVQDFLSHIRLLEQNLRKTP